MTGTSEDADTASRAVEAVWRSESRRIVAALTRMTGDFGWAEDLAQEALLEALAGWPSAGIPDNPGAWLLSVARRRAIDGWRRRERLEQREGLLAQELRIAEFSHPVEDAGDADDIDDDVLRLVYVACHPVLPPISRLALTLRTVAGLTTDEIAQHVCVSRRQLERIFKQYLTRVPSQYYLELRLNRARQMLMQTSKSIIQIGLSCGFSSGPHFSSAYRNFFGVTPREDRNQRRGQGAAEAAPVVAERG